jgi:hypothetical protein
MNNIRKQALLNTLLTTGYIILVASFMYFGSEAKIGRVNSFIAPIAFLMLFVFSAALTGFLIFGKPAQMYVDGKKKEALSLLFNTLGFFSIITFIFLVAIVSFTR